MHNRSHIPGLLSTCTICIRQRLAARVWTLRREIRRGDFWAISYLFGYLDALYYEKQSEQYDTQIQLNRILNTYRK